MRGLFLVLAVASAAAAVSANEDGGHVRTPRQCKFFVGGRLGWKLACNSMFPGNNSKGRYYCHVPRLCDTCCRTWPLGRPTERASRIIRGQRTDANTGWMDRTNFHASAGRSRNMCMLLFTHFFMIGGRIMEKAIFRIHFDAATLDAMGQIAFKYVRTNILQHALSSQPRAISRRRPARQPRRHPRRDPAAASASPSEPAAAPAPAQQPAAGTHRGRTQHPGAVGCAGETALSRRELSRAMIKY